MPKPKSKGAGGKGRRPARRKVAKKEGRPKAKAKGTKPVARKARAAAPKKETRTRAKRVARAAQAVAPKKRTRVRAKPAPAAAKRAATVFRPAAPKPAPSAEGRKESTRMAEQGTKCPIHNAPDCFKPALDAHVAKAYDGYCTKIDWPFVRIIPKGWKPG